ncbi:MAG: TlpA family protein disulfide reductase [Phycisphaerae bacterium]|nr:TlpA family protein disulfide reductase [Phycisphaerae bacterium]
MRFRQVSASMTFLFGMCFSGVRVDASPKIGDVAPAMDGIRWLNATPKSIPGGQEPARHVFVVEFWATWSGPCRKLVPRLTTLHEKYGRQGVIVLSISDEAEADVQAFLKKFPAMPYHVGVDPNGETSKVWIDDIDGIPHAFVVDRDKRVIWSGHPADYEGLESAVRGALTGTFDLAAARIAEANQVKYDELLPALQSLYAGWEAGGLEADKRAATERELITTVEKMIQLCPGDVQPSLIKRQLLRAFGRESEADTFGQSMESRFANSPTALAEIARTELGTDLNYRRPAVMLRCARKAVELSESDDAEILALLAQIECEVGMVDAAAAHQTKALMIVTRPERGYDGDEQKLYRDVLEYYRAVKSLHQIEEKPAEPPSSQPAESR